MPILGGATLACTAQTGLPPRLCASSASDGTGACGVSVGALAHTPSLPSRPARRLTFCAGADTCAPASACVETVFPGYVDGACVAAPQAFADVFGVASLSMSCAAGLLDAFAESWVAAPVGGGMTLLSTRRMGGLSSGTLGCRAAPLRPRRQRSPAWRSASGNVCARARPRGRFPAPQTFGSASASNPLCARARAQTSAISYPSRARGAHLSFVRNNVHPADPSHATTNVAGSSTTGIVRPTTRPSARPSSTACVWPLTPLRGGACFLFAFTWGARASYPPPPFYPPNPIRSAGSWAIHCGSAQPEPPPPSPPAPPPLPALTASFPPSALPTGNNIPPPASPTFTGTRATSGSPTPLPEGGVETPSPPAASGASRSSSLGAVIAVFALLLCGAAV